MAKDRKMPPDYILRKEGDGGFVFLTWNGERGEYEEPRDGCTSLDEQLVVDHAWGHYHEERVNRWNEVHFDDEKIYGYEYDDKVFHPGCVTFPLPRHSQTLNPLADAMRDLICTGCDSPLLDESVLNEYCEHVDGCECDLCMEVAERIEESSSYLYGYRQGLQRVLQDKEPEMTLEQYAAMLGYVGSDFETGYLDGERKAQES